MTLTSSRRPDGIFLGLSLKGFRSVTLILCLVASVYPISSSSNAKMSWYSANKCRALSLFSSVQVLRPVSSQLFKQDLSSFLNSKLGVAFLGPPLGLKGPYRTICDHLFRNLISCYHSGHSSPFLNNNGVVLGIIQLDSCLLTTAVVQAIARAYMQSLKESFVISVKWLCHHIHACSHQN